MFKSIRTIIYNVPDLDRAKRWYADVLGFEPYFDEPFYVGFDVGGFELGLDPNAEGLSGNAGGVEAYWKVESVQQAYDRLIELGATSRTPPQNVGGTIVVATVLDPFGNIVGVIEEG